MSYVDVLKYGLRYVDGSVLLPRPVQIVHGTSGSYTNWGCRCGLCREAHVKIGQRHRAKDPIHASKISRAGHVKRMYGITIDDEGRMYADQGGLCKICQRPMTMRAIDHNHDTKVVRGLLDRTCNLALGQLNDDPAVLRRAARYVETNGQFNDWPDGIGSGLL